MRKNEFSGLLPVWTHFFFISVYYKSPCETKSVRVRVEPECGTFSRRSAFEDERDKAEIRSESNCYEQTPKNSSFPRKAKDFLLSPPPSFHTSLQIRSICFRRLPSPLPQTSNSLPSSLTLFFSCRVFILMTFSKNLLIPRKRTKLEKDEEEEEDGWDRVIVRWGSIEREVSRRKKIIPATTGLL